MIEDHNSTKSWAEMLPIVKVLTAFIGTRNDPTTDHDQKVAPVVGIPILERQIVDADGLLANTKNFNGTVHPGVAETSDSVSCLLVETKISQAVARTFYEKFAVPVLERVVKNERDSTGGTHVNIVDDIDAIAAISEFYATVGAEPPKPPQEMWEKFLATPDKFYDAVARKYDPGGCPAAGPASALAGADPAVLLFDPRTHHFYWKYPPSRVNLGRAGSDFLRFPARRYTTTGPFWDPFLTKILKKR